MSLVLRQIRCLLLVIIASLGLSAAESTGTGLAAQYFANETLSGAPAVTQTDAQVNFNWAGGAAASGLPVDSFSARWDGEIEALYSEPLTLIARTDDGVRLWIDGSLVIDAWVLRSAADSTYTFTAEAGRKYRVRMEYYEHFGSAVAQLEWQSGTLTRAAIPTSQLYPTVPPQPPVGTGTGLLARYYANETLSDAPVVSRTDTIVDFNWGGASPDAAVPVDGFSARWDGEIEARYSEPLTITARTDDGVRVWLDGVLVVDAWVLRSAANSSFTFSAEAGHRYRIRMEYFEHTGAAVAKLWWQSASEFQGPIPSSQLYPTPANDPPVGTGTGLLARFYTNETLSGAPVLTRTDARVDFDWAGGSPGSGVPADVFSARWDGEIEARATEALTLILRTDDGVRLWLDDQLVINAWVLRGAADSTYTFNAQAGHRYRIRIDYFEHHGSAVAKLWWQSPSEPKGPIPTSQLYPTAPVEPPLGTGTGLAGSYFTNETLTGTPALVRLDPVVDFDWAGGSPASSISADSFSARWEGEFEPRYTEDLTIIARTDDGVRMWIDDQPVITNAWILRGAADSTYTFSAQAGQRYRIRMEYYEHFGSAVAKLWWQSAHELRSPIPTTQFYPAPIVQTPVLGFAAATSAVSEKASSTTIAVTLSPVSTTEVTATLTPIGSGIQVPASLTIPAGETSASIPVTIQDDPRYGPDRQVTIALSNPTGAALGQTTHVLSLQNTEPKPTIGFTTNNSFNLEQSGTASVIVRLSAVSAVPTTVSIGTSGSALAGTDYMAPAATLQIPADTFEGTISIPLLADADPEANETIVLTLANPVDATLGAITAHTLTISDGNQAPVITGGPTPATNPVTGTSVDLTLTASDDGAPAALTTTWSVVGTPPAAVTFTPSSNTGFSAATVASFTAPGTYTIQAQVRDAYNATDTEQVTVTVVAARQPQTITFTAPPAKTYGDAAFSLSATASSGLPVILTSGDPSVATVSGNTVTIVGAGSTTITAAQAGDSSWEPAAPVTHPLTVAKASQTITFAALTSRVVGDAPFTLTATASSGQPVSYISSNTSVATVSGSTVTIIAAGNTTITASQAGTANYLAAASVDQVLTVTKQTQTITFAALAGKTYGDAPFTLSATASSGLPVTYTSADPAVATVSGNTVTIVGAGSTTISASQAGEATWEAAPTVEQPLTVAKATQTITFAALTARAVGDAPFTLGATTSSGLAITYTSSDTNVATVSGNTVTIVGAGTTTITASQVGNANYLAAASVPQVQTITPAAKQPQTITFASLPAKTYGDAPFTITATASSGLPVSYASSNTAVATVSGGLVTILKAGMTTITAQQPGDDTYAAATPVPQVLVVGRATQTITFGELEDKVYTDAPFMLTATASSGLPITYGSSDTYVATVSDGMVTLNNGGSTIITAYQVGDENWLAATPVAQLLEVGWSEKQPQTIYYFETVPPKTYGNAPFSLAAWATSGLSVVFTSSDPTILSITGSTATILGAGSVTITATQPGDLYNLPAPPVTQDLIIAKATQTITFAPLATRVLGSAPFTLAATASSTLPITYTSSNPGVASVNGSEVTLLAIGSTTITATQPGNANWMPASLSRNLAVAASNNAPTISAITAKSTNEDVATAAIGFTVSDSETPASNLVVTGNSNNPALVDVSNIAFFGTTGSRSLIITPKANQHGVATVSVTVTDDWAPAATATTTFTLTVNSVADAPTLTAVDPLQGGKPNMPVVITYAGLLAAANEADGDGDVVTFRIESVSSGSLGVRAAGSTAGTTPVVPTGTILDATKELVWTPPNNPPQQPSAFRIRAFDGALLSSTTLTVQVRFLLPNTISFSPVTTRPFGMGPFTLSATAASGLPVSFASSNPSVATINGSLITITGAGTTTITATQAGNSMYDVAAPVDRIFTVGRAQQSIEFPYLVDRSFDDPPFNPQAVASSGLPVVYSSSDGAIATISGSNVVITGIGSVTITASSDGGQNFLPAQASRVLTITSAHEQGPTFDPPSGTYLAPLILSVNSIPEGAEVWYTTAEFTPADPVPGAPGTLLYNQPIQFTTSQSIKAVFRSTQSGVTQISPVSFAHYTLTPTDQFTVSTPNGETSLTSPGFVEISGPTSEVSLTAVVTVDGQTMSTAAVRTAGDNMAYVDAALMPGVTNEVRITATDKAGHSHVTSRLLTWTVIDLSSGTGEIYLRSGDSVQLAALSANGPVTINPGNLAPNAPGIPVSPGAALRTTYNQPGFYEASAWADGVLLGSRTIVVVGVNFPANDVIAAEVEATRSYSVQLQPEGIGSHVRFTSADTKVLQVGSSFTYGRAELALTPKKRGKPIVLARVGNDNGPIIAQKEVTEFEFELVYMFLKTLNESVESKGVSYHLAMRPHIPGLTNEDTSKWSPQIIFDELTGEQVATYSNTTSVEGSNVPDPIAVDHPHLTQRQAALPGAAITKTRVTGVGSITRNYYRLAVNVALDLEADRGVGKRSDGNGDGIEDLDIPQIGVSMTLTPPNTVIAQRLAIIRPREAGDFSDPGTLPWLYGSSALGRVPGIPEHMQPGGNVLSYSGSPSVSTSFSGLPLIWEFTYWGGMLWQQFSTYYTLNYIPPPPPDDGDDGEDPPEYTLTVSRGLSHLTLPGGSPEQPPEMSVGVGSSGFAVITYTTSRNSVPIESYTRRLLPGDYSVSGPPKQGGDPNDRRVSYGTIHVTGSSISLTPSRFGIQTGYIFDATNDFWYQGDGPMGIPQFLTFGDWTESTVNEGYSNHIPLYIATAAGDPDNVTITMTRNNLSGNLQANGQDLFQAGQYITSIQAGQLERLIKYTDWGNIDDRKFYKVHGSSGGKNAECTFQFLADGQITAELRYIFLPKPAGTPSPLAIDVVPLGNDVALLASKRLYVDIPVQTYATPTLNPDLFLRYNATDAFDRGFGAGWQTNYDMRVLGPVGAGAIYDYNYWYHYHNNPTALIDDDGLAVHFGYPLEIPGGQGISQRTSTTVLTRGRYLLDQRYGKALKPNKDWRLGERWRLMKDNNLRYYFNSDGWLVRISSLTGEENIDIERDLSGRATRITDSYDREITPPTLIGTGTFAVPLASIDAPNGGKWSFAYTDGRLSSMTLQSTDRNRHGSFVHEGGGDSRTWTITETDDRVEVNYGVVDGQERKLVWDGTQVTYPTGGTEGISVGTTNGGRSDQAGINHFFRASAPDAYEFWTSATGDSPVKYNRVEVLLDGHLMVTGSRRYLTAGGYHQSDEVWGPLRDQDGVQIEGSRVLLSRVERAVSGLEDSPDDDLVTSYDYYTEGKDLAQVRVLRSPATVSTTFHRGEGRLKSITDERNKPWTVSSYAGFNQPKALTTPEQRTIETIPDDRGLAGQSKDMWQYSSGYARDAMGRVLTMTKPGGATVDADYDPLGMITRQKDELGRESRYFYDRLSRVRRVKITAAASEVESSPALPDEIITYDIEANHDQLVTRKRGDLVLSCVRYDAIGRVVDVITHQTLVAIDPDAAADPAPKECITHHSYDPVSGFLTKIRDARGYETKFEHDRAGRLVRRESPEGNIVTTTYNGLGWLLTQTDGNGGTTRFTYDRTGQVRRTINPAGGWTLAGFDEAGATASVSFSQGDGTSTSFDDDGLPERLRDQFGNVLSINRQKQGANLVQTIKRVGDTAERVSLLDARGLPDGTRTLVGGVEFTNNLDVRADGSMRKMTPAGLGAVDLFIDGYGRGAKATRVMRVAGVDTAVSSIMEADPLTGLPLTSKNTLGLIRKAPYNPVTGEQNSRESNASAPDQAPETLKTEEVVLKRDANGNVLESGVFTGSEQSGTPSLRTYRTYDRDNRMKTMRRSGQELHEWFYDAGGRVQRVERAGAETARYEYNSLNQVVKVTEPGSKVASSVYDTMGVLMSRTVGGLTTTYEYHPRTRFLTRINEPGGKVTIRTPDAKGRLASVAIPPQPATRFEYDDLDRLILTTFPDEKTERRTYLADRNDLDLVTDRLERTIKHHYDPSGLLIEKEINDHGVITRVKVDRSLPATGGMVQTSRVEQNGVDGDAATYRTDRAGRVVAFEQPGAGQVVTTYDLAGRTATKGDRSFHYNANGQLQRIQQSGAGEVTFQYDAQGRVQSQQLPNGLGRSYTYNASGNLNTLTQSIDGVIEAWTLQRDQQARVSHVDGPGHALDFGYDELGRLQRAVRTGDLPSATYYAYDSAGNRTWSVVYRNTEPQVQEFTGPAMPPQVAPQGGTWSIVDQALNASSASEATTALTLSGKLDGTVGTCVPEVSIQVRSSAPSQLGASVVSGFRLTGTAVAYQAVWMVTRPDVPGSFDPPQPVGRLVLRRVEATGTSTIAIGNAWPVSDEVQTLSVIVWPDERVSVSTVVAAGAESITAYCPGVGTDPGNTLPTVGLITAATGPTGAALPVATSFDRLTWTIADQPQRTGLVYNQFNQLIGETLSGEQSAQVQYGYDDLGRMTSRTRTGDAPDAASYGYDALDRLVSSTINGVPETYGYIADTWMRRTSVNPYFTTAWAYDGTNMVSMTTGAGAGFTTRYLSHGGRPLWEVDDQGVRSYGHDPLGNVIGLVGPLSNGNVTINGYQRAFSYDAFGSLLREQIGQLGQDNLPVMTTAIGSTTSGVRGKGMWYDARLGSYKTQTRFYAPEVGRFTQMDPARAGSNWYAYCGGDPVNKWDPSGLDEVWIDNGTIFWQRENPGTLWDSNVGAPIAIGTTTDDQWVNIDSRFGGGLVDYGTLKYHARKTYSGGVGDTISDLGMAGIMSEARGDSRTHEYMPWINGTEGALRVAYEPAGLVKTGVEAVGRRELAKWGVGRLMNSDDMRSEGAFPDSMLFTQAARRLDDGASRLEVGWEVGRDVFVRGNPATGAPLAALDIYQGVREGDHGRVGGGIAGLGMYAVPFMGRFTGKPANGPSLNEHPAFLEYTALRKQGYTPSETVALMREFRAGNNPVGEWAFHFTNLKGARGIVSDMWLRAGQGLAGRGVYTGTTPTPSFLLTHVPIFGWGLWKSPYRIPVNTENLGSVPRYEPGIPPKTLFFPTNDGLPLGTGGSGGSNGLGGP